MTAAAGVAYRSLMRTTSGHPPGRTGGCSASCPRAGHRRGRGRAGRRGPARADHGAARGQPDRQPLDLLAYLLLAAGPVALLWRWRSPAGCWPP